MFDSDFLDVQTDMRDNRRREWRGACITPGSPFPDPLDEDEIIAWGREIDTVFQEHLARGTLDRLGN